MYHNQAHGNHFSTGGQGQKSPVWHNRGINFWPQSQIFGGQLTPWPGLPAPLTIMRRVIANPSNNTNQSQLLYIVYDKLYTAMNMQLSLQFQDYTNTVHFTSKLCDLTFDHKISPQVMHITVSLWPNINHNVNFWVVSPGIQLQTDRYRISLSHKLWPLSF